MPQDWFSQSTTAVPPKPAARRGILLRDPYRERDEGRKDEDQGLQRQAAARDEARLAQDRQRLALAQQQDARQASTQTYDVRTAAANSAKAEDAARNAPSDRRFDRADKLRADYEALPSVKNYTNALPVYAAGLSSGADPAGDLNLISAYAKVLDPNSVVREGEAASVAGGDTWVNQKQADLQKQLGAGGTFKPEFRRRLREEMAGRMGQLNQLFIADRVRYKHIADRNETDVRDVVGDHPGGRYQDLSEQVLGKQQKQLDYDGMPIARDPATGGSDTRGAGAPGAGGSYRHDPSGNRTFLTERDKAFAAEAQAAFRAGAGRGQIDAIAAKYGAPPFGADLDAAIGARSRGVKGTSFAPTPTGREDTGIIGSLVAPFADSSFGSFSVGAGNAATFGQLGNIAQLTGSSEGGTQIAMEMTKENTLPYVLGEITGSIAPAMGLARGMGAASQFVSNPVARALVANPVTSDALYGAAYGASSADNAWEGGVQGGAMAAGGSVVGGRVGRSIASLLAPTNQGINAGERAVMAAVDRTGRDTVVDALGQADRLGAPATLADVSPEVASLTGAAIRRSPTVAGQARETLVPRGRGQYDRFVGAVERDLGPVQNIPQRSEDLIQQARAQAGPLYDAAYAAPGSGAVHPRIESLLNRPSMRGALARARTIAAEEGRDPTSLGFTLDDEGNTVLLQVPSWQTLDYAKRGMDDVLEGFRDSTSGRLRLDEHGRAIDATRRQFLSIVDTVNPDYAAARAAYAGPATERDALLMGQEAASLSPDQLAVNVGNATPTQADQMRLGFQSQLAENAGRLRYSTNPFESVLGTPAMEQRLGTLYPNGRDNIARLLAQSEIERQMAASSNRLIGNSLTAERQAADQAFQGADWLGPAAEVGANVLLGQVPIGTAIRGGVSQRARDAITLGLGNRATAKAEQIGPIALSPDPSSTIAQILALDQQRLANRAIAAAAGERGQLYGRNAGSSVAAALIPYATSN
jgi:hypothetical protein